MNLLQLYTELTCPLDNFELVIFSLAGPDGKSYPLCPYCYNHPPFEGAEVIFGGVGSGKDGGKGTGKGSRGMPCSICPHPTCRHSMIQQGVCSCPECDGTLVLDPISAPKWRLDCNKCNCLVYLPHNAHRISVSKDHCDDCGSALLEVSLHAICKDFGCWWFCQNWLFTSAHPSRFRTHENSCEQKCLDKSHARHI